MHRSHAGPKTFGPPDECRWEGARPANSPSPVRVVPADFDATTRAARNLPRPWSSIAPCSDAHARIQSDGAGASFRLTKIRWTRVTRLSVAHRFHCAIAEVPDLLGVVESGGETADVQDDEAEPARMLAIIDASTSLRPRIETVRASHGASGVRAILSVLSGETHDGDNIRSGAFLLRAAPSGEARSRGRLRS